MTGVEFHLNKAAGAALLKSPQMMRLVAAAANKIADNARGQKVQVGGFKGQDGPIDIPVTVKTDVTDRARATVILAHPAGIAVQAKYGTLTKAAGAAGHGVES